MPNEISPSSPDVEDRVSERASSIAYYPDLEQGSDEWLQVRCGLLTASEMKLIIAAPPEPEMRIKKNGEPYKQREWSPFSDNDKCRAHLYELLAQRINKYVEPGYISDDMLRGKEDEITARALYEEHIAPVQTMGFITNNRWGFTLGFSPDGLVGDDGFIEIKSRDQKYQARTLIENVIGQTIPADFLIQQQTGHAVSERAWCDFMSFCGGTLMPVIRVYPDPVVQNAIIEASGAFERRMAEEIERMQEAIWSGARLIQTERKVILEMHL